MAAALSPLLSWPPMPSGGRCELDASAGYAGDSHHADAHLRDLAPPPLRGVSSEVRWAESYCDGVLRFARANELRWLSLEQMVHEIIGRPHGRFGAR
jgi:hypothetical protein